MAKFKPDQRERISHLMQKINNAIHLGHVREAGSIAQELAKETNAPEKLRKEFIEHVMRRAQNTKKPRSHAIQTPRIKLRKTGH